MWRYMLNYFRRRRALSRRMADLERNGLRSTLRYRR